MAVVVDTPPVEPGGLNVTVVVGTLDITVVPMGIIPLSALTDMLAVIPAVSGVQAKVSNVAPNPKFLFGIAVIDEFAELNVMSVDFVTPDRRPVPLNKTVIIVTVCVTVVPGAIFVPLTVIPTPIPIGIPSEFSVSKVSGDPAAAATLGYAVKGGIT